MVVGMRKGIVLTLAFLFLLLVNLSGCIFEKERIEFRYVCADSSVVSDPRDCPDVEPDVVTVTNYVCPDGDVVENSDDCLIITTTESAPEKTTTTIATTEENDGELGTTTIVSHLTTTVVTTTKKRTTTTAAEVQTTTAPEPTATTTIVPEASTTTTIEEEGDVTISATQFDAPGNDNDNLNEEWIELENGMNVDVDMDGWTLSDESGKVYDFPSGFVLHAGDSVKIHTGTGTDTSSDLYWNYGRSIWNNDGDTATLRNNEGDIIDQFSE